MKEATVRRSQQERREGTIRKLLDAATETLIEVGYAEASVQRICERAELSQGALFRHFATREALMVAVGEDVGAELLTAYRKRFLALPPGDNDVGVAIRLQRIRPPGEFLHVGEPVTVAVNTPAMAEIAEILDLPCVTYPILIGVVCSGN